MDQDASTFVQAAWTGRYLALKMRAVPEQLALHGAPVRHMPAAEAREFLRSLLLPFPYRREFGQRDPLVGPSESHDATLAACKAFRESLRRSGIGSSECAEEEGPGPDRVEEVSFAT